MKTDIEMKTETETDMDMAMETGGTRPKTHGMTHRTSTRERGLVLVALLFGVPTILSTACSDSSSPGAPPTLGAQIDRMGRPAINTAITDPFDGDATAHGAKQDPYNAAPPATGSPFEAQFEANLAILDGLDMTCGNQFAADITKTDATRYKALADVLTDDELYVDTSSGTCTTYLGVEANATGIIPNTDCGGRTLTEDVVD